MKARKPFGVWMLLSDGERWMFSRESTLAEAMCTARTLRGGTPLFQHYKVWIASPSAVGHRPSPSRRKQETTAIAAKPA